MKKTTALVSLLLMGLLWFPVTLHAQDAVTLDAQDAKTVDFLPESKVWVDGTSNKSPTWTVHATEFTGTVEMTDEAMPKISKATLTVVADKIVSRKSTIMDRLMRNALKVEEHPQITYDLISASPADAASLATNEGALTFMTRGNLTIAGVTNEIEMTVMGERLDGDQMRFTGSYPMLVSDYGMQPPTAMFGALRTGDEVVFNFELLINN